jgi:hypothetical protein
VDAFWVNWGGERLGEAGLTKRLYWRSEKRFGREGRFGPHRFRHCLGTVGPMEDPDAAISPSAILGNTPAVHRQHYDRGQRSASAGRFYAGLRAERQRTEGLARRIFESRRRGAVGEDAPPDEEAA